MRQCLTPERIRLPNLLSLRMTTTVARLRLNVPDLGNSPSTSPIITLPLHDAMVAGAAIWLNLAPNTP